MKKDLAQAKYRSSGMLRASNEMHHKLLGWFDRAKRAMPWRETCDPYAIWLSETMLQQTQVETVKPYYHKFLKRFPTVADLARADLQDVLVLWAGLGYYRRAKHLHLAARQMMERHAGRVPGTLEELLSLPGVGRYTAGAVGSIAFGLAAPVVDGNVMRVIARLTGFAGDIADPKNAAFFWGVMEEILAGARGGGRWSAGSGARGKKTASSSQLPPEAADSGPSSAVGTPLHPSVSGFRYGDINQAVMELGATVCAAPPSVPACLVCPVREFCRAYAEGRQMELPVKRKKGQTPMVRGVALVVTRENTKCKTQNAKPCGGADGNAAGEREVLVMQRPMGGVWEGMWEFPVVEGEREPQSHRDTEDAQKGSGRLREEHKNSKYELHLGISIKNGRGGKRGGVGGGDGDLDMNLGRWVEAVLGVRVRKVVECGEVRHQLTHRLMVFRVIRCELGEKQEARSKKQEEGMERRKTKDERRNEGAGIVLPVGATAGGERYVAAKWVGWPLSEGNGVPPPPPMARVVWKVAERAVGK